MILTGFGTELRYLRIKNKKQKSFNKCTYFSVHLKDNILCLVEFIDSVSDMASSGTQDWLMLSHPVIFEKIMLIVGLDSLESLDNCRQVCKTWNTMIMNKIWKNPTKKWGTIIQRRIERSWDDEHYYPSDKKISQAKLLGKHKPTQNEIMFSFRNQRYPHP